MNLIKSAFKLFSALYQATSQPLVPAPYCSYSTLAGPASPAAHGPGPGPVTPSLIKAVKDKISCRGGAHRFQASFPR
jgi:hypothetical protein